MPELGANSGYVVSPGKRDNAIRVRIEKYNSVGSILGQVGGMHCRLILHGHQSRLGILDCNCRYIWYGQVLIL